MEKKAVIIGGSSGIGKATAHRFAQEGWRVLIAAPASSIDSGLKQSLPGAGHFFMPVDVTNATQLEQLENQVAAHFGSFQVLINSAGISSSVPVVDSPFENWDKALQIMLYGAVNSCRRLIPLLEDGGRIIHITSIHYERVAHGSSSYGMAKAAITQFTRSLALELAPRGILANAIAPGFVDTPMSIKADGRNELDSEWFLTNYIRYDHLPLKRAAQPEEIAGVAWFLAGPDASYITGSVITVDGGLTITF